MNGYVIGLVILIVLVLAASAAASVIWDIDNKRHVPFTFKSTSPSMVI